MLLAMKIHVLVSIETDDLPFSIDQYLVNPSVAVKDTFSELSKSI